MQMMMSLDRRTTRAQIVQTRLEIRRLMRELAAAKTDERLELARPERHLRSIGSMGWTIESDSDEKVPERVNSTVRQLKTLNTYLRTLSAVTWISANDTFVSTVLAVMHASQVGIHPFKIMVERYHNGRTGNVFDDCLSAIGDGLIDSAVMPVLSTWSIYTMSHGKGWERIRMATEIIAKYAVSRLGEVKEDVAGLSEIRPGTLQEACS